LENIIDTVSYERSPRCPGYRYLAYPLLLTGNVALIASLTVAGLPLELALTAAFMGSLVVLGIHERLLPFRADWQPNRREWLQNLGQFLPNGLLDNAGQLVALLIAMQFGAQQPLLPLVIAVPLAIVISEFFSYWIHRLGHEIPWLWKVHGIHHTPGKVNLVNTNTIHFLDMFVSSLVSALPLVLIGFSGEAIALALFFTGLQNFIVHVNADIRPGRLEQVFMGPAHHRLHHSVIVSEAQNFGTSITLWDQLFGTYVSPEKVPLQVGIASPNDFPDAAAVMQSQLFPFRQENI
jgi:sterol desaturase/sphingolipid hydroxylase (fatty acid hydroxylase superfamily)